MDVVVEAKASDPLDTLHTDYAITLAFADGDRVENAVVSARASDGAETVLPIQVGSEGDLYMVHFVFPQPGQWTLEVAVDHPDVQLELTLVEAIPIGGPGAHVVRLDTAHPQLTSRSAPPSDRLFENRQSLGSSRQSSPTRQEDQGSGP